MVGFGQLDLLKRDAHGSCRCFGGSLASVALIDIGELGLLAGRVLEVHAKSADRGTGADNGRCGVLSKKAVKRIDRNVNP